MKRQQQKNSKSWTRRVITAAVAFACCLSAFCAGQTVESSTVAKSAGQTQSEGHVTKRAVTVADSIQMTGVGDPDFASDGPTKGTLAQFSPNGKQFVVVLKKGNLQDNTNEYSIVLFKTAEALRSPTPRLVVSMSSSSNRPAIQDVVWLNDNDTLLFLGERPGETSQLYSIQCSSGRLTKLTHHAANLASFVTTLSGDQIAYVAENQDSSLMNDGVSRNGFIVTNQDLTDLIREKLGEQSAEYSLFITEPGNRTQIKVKLEGQLEHDYFPMAFSPDGTHLLIETTASHILEMWGQYEDQFIQINTHRRSKHPSQSSGIYQWELVDTRTGASSTLSDAPVSTFGSDMAWSPDSKSLVVSNAYLPLNVDNPEEQRRRKAHAFLVEYRIPGPQFQTIDDEDLRIVRWNPKNNTVVCDIGRADSYVGKNTPKAYFQKNGETWSRVSPPVEAKLSLPEIVLEDDMHTPPRILAIAPDGNQKSLLMDLNPQFRDFALAKVEEVSWKSPRGDEVKGGLYWPLNYVPGRKYPLVIQTHGWSSSRFMLDGPFTTAFAAQPLAGKGFFVLQFGEDAAWHVMGSPEEAPSAIAAYESGIDYLDSRGLIDRNLVGIIGFSRTCYYVTQMLAFSKYHIAAAVIADGMKADYFEYFTASNSSDSWAAALEALNGGAPYGDALSSWIKRVSSFHLDQVHAPLRIQALHPGSLLAEWNWFSGLYILGKSVELVYLPDAEHVIQKPWERMVSQQGDVDWFCFWLKGEEDPDPAKAEQYQRWRELRNLQKKN